MRRSRAARAGSSAAGVAAAHSCSSSCSSASAFRCFSTSSSSAAAAARWRVGRLANSLFPKLSSSSSSFALLSSSGSWNSHRHFCSAFAAVPSLHCRASSCQASFKASSLSSSCSSSPSCSSSSPSSSKRASAAALASLRILHDHDPDFAGCCMRFWADCAASMPAPSSMQACTALSSFSTCSSTSSSSASNSFCSSYSSSSPSSSCILTSGSIYKSMPLLLSPLQLIDRRLQSNGKKTRHRSFASQWPMMQSHASLRQSSRCFSTDLTSSSASTSLSHPLSSSSSSSATSSSSPSSSATNAFQSPESLSPSPRWRHHASAFLREFNLTLRLMLLFTALLYFVRHAICDVLSCVGPSMQPTMSASGDLLLIVRLEWLHVWRTLQKRWRALLSSLTGAEDAEARGDDRRRGRRRNVVSSWEEEEAAAEEQDNHHFPLSLLQRGQVVVAASPTNASQFVCKRIIGLPGDRITVHAPLHATSDHGHTLMSAMNGESVHDEFDAMSIDRDEDLMKRAILRMIETHTAEEDGEHEEEKEGHHSSRWSELDAAIQLMQTLQRRSPSSSASSSSSFASPSSSSSSFRAGDSAVVMRVPAGHVWLQGDNLDNSSDSRSYGPLPIALIKGVIVAKVWPRVEWIENTMRYSEQHGHPLRRSSTPRPTPSPAPLSSDALPFFFSLNAPSLSTTSSAPSSTSPPSLAIETQDSEPTSSDSDASTSASASVVNPLAVEMRDLRKELETSSRSERADKASDARLPPSRLSIQIIKM